MDNRTYLFYDIETTGLNPCFDQILQFAAIRTDMAFNEIEHHEFFIRLNCDVVPSPMAVITHRIGVKQTKNGELEYIAIQKIHRLLNTPGTISIGYNTLNFDDEFLRFSFYRNLLPPYTHQYANNCSRIDIYPITVMYYLYKPEALEWPIIDGKPSLKLENLNEANALATGRAHNAMVDVRTSLALTKKLARHPDQWNYVCGYFDKQTDIERTEKLPMSFETPTRSFKEAILVNGNIGAALNYQVPALCLGPHLHYTNQTLWLRLDDENLSHTTSENIAENTFIYHKKMGEMLLLLPINERFMHYLSDDRIALAKANKQWLQQHTSLLEQICDYHQNFKYPKVPNLDIDAALYEINFPTSHEEFLFQQFHLASFEKKLNIAQHFPNEIRREQAIRILGRYVPDVLDTAEKELFVEYLSNFKAGNKIPVDYKGNNKLSAKQTLQQITALLASNQLDNEQKQLLDELQTHIMNHISH